MEAVSPPTRFVDGREDISIPHSNPIKWIVSTKDNPELERIVIAKTQREAWILASPSLGGPHFTECIFKEDTKVFKEMSLDEINDLLVLLKETANGIASVPLGNLPTSDLCNAACNSISDLGELYEYFEMILLSKLKEEKDGSIKQGNQEERKEE